MIKPVCTLLTAGFVAVSASAGMSYDFISITNNNATDSAIGAAQFSVEVNDAGSGSVEFLFKNIGPDAASMVQLYWDDSAGVPSSLNAWSTTTPTKATANYGVNFSGGSASPANLPGGNPIGFDADFSIQALSKKGKSKNGVGAGEDVSIFFSYAGSYQDVIHAMDQGGLVVGLHAQAFDSGGSESFTNKTKVTGVPSPTAAFAGLAMIGIAGLRRRRRA